MQLDEIIGGYNCIGFAGSQSPYGRIPPRRISPVFQAIAPKTKIIVGDGGGLEWYFRTLSQSLAFGRTSDGSTVMATKEFGGLFISFCATPPPKNLKPSDSITRCYGGHQLIEWGAVALSVGLGLPTLVLAIAGAPDWLDELDMVDNWFISGVIEGDNKPNQLQLF